MALHVALHLALRRPGEPVDHREAEAGALAERLRGDGRNEGPGGDLRAHADRGVAHADADVR